MPSSTDLSRRSLRGDAILEINWPEFPPLPPEAQRLPGMRAWEAEMKLYAERQRAAFEALRNNLGIATSTP